jgi:hypothetical protein
MGLSRRCAERLINLAKIKLSCLEITDREDMRKKELPKPSTPRLKAKRHGEDGRQFALPRIKGRGRRPRHLQARSFPRELQIA